MYKIYTFISANTETFAHITTVAVHVVHRLGVKA